MIVGYSGNAQKDRIVALLLCATLFIPFAIVSNRLSSGIVKGGIKPTSVGRPSSFSSSSHFTTEGITSNHRPPDLRDRRNLVRKGGWIQLGNQIQGQGYDFLGQVLLTSDGKRLAVLLFADYIIRDDNVGRFTLYDWNESTSTWEYVLTRGGASLSMSKDGSRIVVGNPEDDSPAEEGYDDDDDVYVDDDYEYPADDDYDYEYEQACSSICSDGSLIPQDSWEKIAIQDDPILGTLTCYEYQLMAAELTSRQCNSAFYVGVKHCGCQVSVPFCDLCEDGSAIPPETLGRQIFFRHTCLDVAGAGYRRDPHDESCPAFQNTLGLYCGCDNPMASKDACRVCSNGEVVPDPNRTVLVGELLADCGRLEFSGNNPDEEYSCGEVQSFGVQCCANAPSAAPTVPYDDDGHGEPGDTDIGSVTIYDWNGATLKSIATINGTYANQQLGTAVQISEDGLRFITAVNDFGPTIYVYDMKGASWVQSSSISVRSRNVHLSRDGKRIAVSTRLGQGVWGASEVQVYEEKGSSWSQIGPNLKGLFMALSAEGDHIVTAMKDSSVESADTIFKSFRLVGTSWKKSGRIAVKASDINTATGVTASMSSDGNRLGVGFPQGSEDVGIARVYDFDGSAWSQTGEDLNPPETENSFDRQDSFGSKVSVSGDGDRVAVSTGNGGVTLFQFQIRAPDGPFPDGFHEVTCAYTSCLDNLLSTYGRRTKLGDGQKAYDASRRKVAATQSIMKKGKVAASLRNLRSAIKLIEGLNDAKPGLAKAIGKQASACAIELVEDFVGVYENKHILDKAFLDNVIKPKLAVAKAERASKKWKESITNSNTAIWNIMDELGETLVPLCDA